MVILHSNVGCNNVACDFLQLLEFTSKYEAGIREDFKVLLQRKVGAINGKIDRPVLDEKLCFKILELSFSSEVYWLLCLHFLHNHSRLKTNRSFDFFHEVSLSLGCVLSL